MHKVAVTGADGFIGKNLVSRLSQLNSGIEVMTITRSSTIEDWQSGLNNADFVFHLAGTNRDETDDGFVEGNVNTAVLLCESLRQSCKPATVVFASSIKAGNDDIYGATKLKAEQVIAELSDAGTHSVHSLRLPNVFGKWCRPNYNSVVATFCHQLTRDLPIEVNNSNPTLSLIYIDDLIDIFIEVAVGGLIKPEEKIYEKTSKISLVALANNLTELNESRRNGHIPNVGDALQKQLYSTLVSHLPHSSVVTEYTRNSDARGIFAEIIKGEHCGQFAYLTSRPGVVRGNHYHHSKVERFVVTNGHARFDFECIQEGTRFYIESTGDDSKIIETPPGFSHSITNIGSDELVVLLWANEMFDAGRPDTIAFAVQAKVD